MRTTIDLDEGLLRKAKFLARQNRTTLKAVVENALRRELNSTPVIAPEDQDCFEIGALGLPVLKRRPGTKRVTLEQIRSLGLHDEF